MYISFSMDPYKYVVITSMKRISSPFEIVKLIKKRNVIVSMTGEYVSSQSIPSLYEKPCATNSAYDLIILITISYKYPFVPNRLYIFRCLDYISKTSHFVNEFNSVCIASFHFGQSFLCRHSSTFRGSRSSSFLMILEATWKVKILIITILFRSHFSPMCT